MANTESLKCKHALFEEGQLLITREEMRGHYHDRSLETQPPDKYVNFDSIPAGTALIVLSEGTVDVSYYMKSVYRSLTVFYTIGDVPHERLITIDPDYGPEELQNMFEFAPKKKD